MAKHNKGATIIKQQLTQILQRAADDAIDRSAFFAGFTGNLATGTVAVVFADNKQVYTKTTEERLGKSAVRRKLRYSEGRVFLANPYSGGARSFQAEVDTDGGYAKRSALTQAKSTPRGSSYVLRIANGAEYMKWAGDNYGYKTLYDLLPQTSSIIRGAIKR